VESDQSLTPSEEYYAGSYRPTEQFLVQVSIWNNRWGTEAIANAVAARVTVTFDTLEDSVLLPLFSVQVGQGTFAPLNVQGNKGVIDIGSLSGISNDGSTNAITNYKNITLKIDSIPTNLRRSLRNMFLDIEFDEGSV
jgi:hypothetical protein